MAKKTILGVDIGHDQLKLALVRGNSVLKTAVVPMPENLLRQGRITSRESMGELIRNTMKQHKIRANRAALVLPNETVFVKNVEMPLMTVEQLEYNLPFEFNDYITGELREYVFDYAVVSPPIEGSDKKKAKKRSKNDKKMKGATPENAPDPVGATPENGGSGAENGGSPGDGEAAAPTSLELLAVGTTRVVLEDAQETLRKAGLKLAVSAPAISAYINLLRASHKALAAPGEEYGILDLGYDSIRLYMFQRDKHVATRVLEIGLSSLDGVLADSFGVDPHLAHTYLMSNFEGCQDRDECHNAYNNIAVELMRALNFYRFSNPNSALTDIWVCGGGAVIEPLTGIIADTLGMQLHTADELVPGGEKIPDCNAYMLAIGIAMGDGK